MPSQVRSLQGTHNAARRVLDSVTSISGSVSEVTIFLGVGLELNIVYCEKVSSAPAANLARWAADQVEKKLIEIMETTETMQNKK